MAIAEKSNNRQTERHHELRPHSDSPVATASAIRQSIVASLPDARVEASGTGGHYTIDVVSAAFEGKSTLERQRLIYRAIAPLMSGESAPVHAVDRLNTRVPE